MTTEFDVKNILLQTKNCRSYLHGYSEQKLSVVDTGKIKKVKLWKGFKKIP